MWSGRSDNIPGLIVEADSYEELAAAILEAISDLVAAGALKQRPATIKVIAEREQPIPAAA